MNTKHFFHLMAMMLIGVATMCMTSCKKDEPSQKVEQWAIGKWYMEKPKNVTIGKGENAVECSKVVLAGQFDANGEGFWALIYVDKQNRAIQPTGVEAPYFANCSFSTQDKTVLLTLTANYLPISQKEWTLTYDGDCLKTKFEDGVIDLHRITTEEDAMFQEWMQQLGFGASAENYNINDEDFTPTSWRDEEAIYIYDGVGVDIEDAKGRKGYTSVNLPWYEGDKLTNLPEGFCDDITPENGWEWVLNRCGSRAILNNNFFAVYNKYTGILRFFYYLPTGYSTGNDHVWQVSMTDNLASFTTIPYGVPNDSKISNKAAVGQTGQGTYMEYVTPWTDYLSDDGLIVPNAGWWAFDVDLSLTRPETVGGSDNIKLQMRSWNNNHTSLFSTMAANIDGELKGTFEGRAPVTVSSGKGLFGQIKDFVGLKGKVTDVISSFSSGNYLGAIKGGISLAKSGMSIVKSGKPSTSGGGTIIEGSFDGTINMMMNGTINTDGVIKGSAPTVGIASPTFYLKDFDTQNSHLGQGVWNLKKTPMVYTNYSRTLADLWPENDDAFDANWTFFDPSSIEVELNPEIFPENEIEWMQVDAVAGARQEMNWKGTDPFRQAMGLKPIADYKYQDGDGGAYLYGLLLENDVIANYVFNFVGAGDFDGQTIDEFTFPISYAPFESGWANKDGDKQYPRVFGRGTEDYIIEPQITSWEQRRYSGPEGLNYIILFDVPFLVPAVEINVTVQVKLKSQEEPVMLSRIYLPDYQYLNIMPDEAKVLEVIDRIYAKQNLSPKTAGHTGSYDFQATRINKCFKLISGYSR